MTVNQFKFKHISSRVKSFFFVLCLCSEHIIWFSLLRGEHYSGRVFIHAVDVAKNAGVGDVANAR